MIQALIGLIAGIASFFASAILKKTVFTLAVVAGALALTTAFVGVLKGLANGIEASLPAWAVGVGYFIPDNAAVCFSAIVAAVIARWIYDYHMGVLKMAATVS